MPTAALPDELSTKPLPARRTRRGRDRALDQAVALERPNSVLNRAAAGMRAATINKLLYDEAETAVILGVSTETLKVWRREGRGPPWVRLGDAKLVRYPYEGLGDYVAALPVENAPTQAAALITASENADDSPRAA
jgi:hypothetical protein